MRFRALACDYDGTIATGGVVEPATRAALQRWKDSGRRLVLVTGRLVASLERLFPGLELFDAVVAENGAVLHLPAGRATRALVAPPPPAFVAALRARGVADLAVGRIIVATSAPYVETVRDTIATLGLELQVILNKEAVMVLPSGVDKASGLGAALAELGVPASATVAAGDAENDQSLLAAAGFAVAVANALPALKARADLVTEGEAGAGVAELCARLLGGATEGREGGGGRA